jgi:2-haloalkanoic acid dehalogenase type II
MELQGVFLDMYGTLTDGDRAAVEAVCGRIIDEHNLDTMPRQLSIDWGVRFFSAIERANGAAFRTLFDLEQITLDETMQALGVRLDPQPYAEALRDYWQNPPLHDDVREALARLDLPVCIVSNADREDVAVALERSGLGGLPFVTSQCARSYKPHGDIFRLALHRTGWDPARVVHVGDSLHSDVGGAQPLGLHTAWVCRDGRIHDVGEAQPDHTVADLRELVAWLGNHVLRTS